MLFPASIGTVVKGLTCGKPPIGSGFRNIRPADRIFMQLARCLGLRLFRRSGLIRGRRRGWTRAPGVHHASHHAGKNSSRHNDGHDGDEKFEEGAKHGGDCKGREHPVTDAPDFIFLQADYGFFFLASGAL